MAFGQGGGVLRQIIKRHEFYISNFAAGYNTLRRYIICAPHLPLGRSPFPLSHLAARRYPSATLKITNITPIETNPFTHITKESNMKRIRKAVIPAAGFGTRFLPETKAMPKEMLPIVDKPTIQYIVEEIKASGIEQILIISGHAKRAIEDHFDSSPELEQHLYESGKMDLLKEVRQVASVKIHYTRQQYMRGLGDAILCAKDFIDGEPFGVILGDDVVYNANGEPALRQLMDQYEKTGSTVIGCQIVRKDQVSSYGIVDGIKTDDPNLLKVKDMIEKPSIEEAPSRFAALGRYVITPEVFDVLEQTKPGKGGEIQLTDALRVMAHNGNVYAYNFTGKRYDTGNKLGYLKATVEFALRRKDLGPQFRAYLEDLLAKEK